MKLTRRSLLGGAAAASALGCGEAEMERGIPPWHMWGNNVVARVISAGPNTPGVSTQQLIKVGYARPENWTFIFASRLVRAPAGNINVTVNYDLTVGVGRSQVTIENFCIFSWDWTTTPATPPVGRQLYATSVRDKEFIFGGILPGPDEAHRITEIPAQDIQLQARVNIISLSSGEVCEVDVHAYFTPKVHIRPEWYRNPPRFPGGEG